MRFGLRTTCDYLRHPTLGCQPAIRPAVQALTRALWCAMCCLRLVAVPRLLRPAWWTILSTLKLCKIERDHVTELRSTGKEKTCELPDKNIITIGTRRFDCASVSFQPSFIVKAACGFHDV